MPSPPRLKTPISPRSSPRPWDGVDMKKGPLQSGVGYRSRLKNGVRLKP
jgi:hypothetical protein